MFGSKSFNTINSISINQSNGSNIVIINGVKYDLPPGNISVCNNEIYVNGKLYDVEKETGNTFKGTVNINITTDQNIDNISCNGNMTINGSLNNSRINVGDSLDISGDVSSSRINAGDSITIEGDFNGGNMSAGDDINIRNYINK